MADPELVYTYYADPAYAAAYHNTRLSGPAWTALSTNTKAAALQSATDALGAYAAARGGWAETYTEETLPEAIKQACCLEALELTRPEAAARLSAQRQGVRSISIGQASESYTDARGVQDEIMSPQAARLVRPYLKRTGSGVAIQ